MQAVNLIYVKNVISRTVNGTFQEISFAVRVRDIGYGKQVAIHWCGEDQVWRETSAEFRCALDDGFEAWVAEMAVPLTTESAIPGNIQFAACLARDGERHWDSRFGSNYQSDADSGVIVFAPVDLRVVGCHPELPPGMVSLPLEIAVRREVEPQAVAVHWTVDGWVTRHQAQA